MVPVVVEQWAHTLLLWVGFGTVVGLLAKALLPGRDPGGPLATLLLGILGTVIGSAVVSFSIAGAHVTPLSLWGFLAGTVGAIALLLVHRVLSGRYFAEAGTGEVIVAGKTVRRHHKGDVAVKQ